jgi:hypothetical protein
LPAPQMSRIRGTSALTVAVTPHHLARGKASDSIVSFSPYP